METSGTLTNIQALRVGIVGASLGGLSAANTLRNIGASVTVYEKFESTFSSRGGGLGSDLALLQDIRQSRQRPESTNFYGDIWNYLYEGLPEGTVRFDQTIDSIGDVESPTIQGITYDLVILADGGFSALRQCVTTRQPEYGGYVLYRGLLPHSEFSQFQPGFVGYPGKTWFHGGFIVGKPDRAKINFGCYQTVPQEKVPMPEVGINRQMVKQHDSMDIPDWIVPMMERDFGGQWVKLWKLGFAKGKINPHPVYEFAAEKVVNGRVVLIGDCAHMATPRTGAGAYTAMVDAVMLARHIDKYMPSHGIDKALDAYNSDGTSRAQDLYQSSLRLQSQMLSASRKST